MIRPILFWTGLTALGAAFLSLGADLYWSAKGWHLVFQPVGAYWFAWDAPGLSGWFAWIDSAGGETLGRMARTVLGFPLTGIAFTLAFGFLLAAGRLRPRA